MIRTAILVDGAFYRKRAYHLYGDKTPAERADELEWYCKRHIREEHNEKCSLYRIFYYIRRACFGRGDRRAGAQRPSGRKN